MIFPEPKRESHEFRKHVQLEKVSDKREEYVKGELFKEGDEVVLKENNEVGTIQPISEIAKICNSHNVLFHTDAVQAVGKININVSDLNIDLL